MFGKGLHVCVCVCVHAHVIEILFCLEDLSANKVHNKALHLDIRTVRSLLSVQMTLG